jgi:hypothetical protein
MAAIGLLLEQTSPLFNVDPAGAPLPLARSQYDAGRLLMAGQAIGEYLRVKDMHAVTQNVAAVTITLFFPSDTPVSMTLQGVHSFDNGNETGSITASIVPGVVGTGFSYSGATKTLTLLFP